MIRTIGIFLAVLVVACVEEPESHVLAQETFTMRYEGIYDNDEIAAPQTGLPAKMASPYDGLGLLERIGRSRLGLSPTVEPARYGVSTSAVAAPSCDCQRGHWGRELLASVCQSGWDGKTRGCLYARGQPIYWANQQREEYIP